MSSLGMEICLRGGLDQAGPGSGAADGARLASLEPSAVSFLFGWTPPCFCWVFIAEQSPGFGKLTQRFEGILAGQRVTTSNAAMRRAARLGNGDEMPPPPDKGLLICLWKDMLGIVNSRGPHGLGRNISRRVV